MTKKLLSVLLILVISIIQAQTKTVAGVVSDASGPLPGVSILVKGTTVGVETDFDGKYSVQAKIGDVLVFSFVGMKEVEKVVGKRDEVNVLMEEDGAVLDEVVVTALAGKVSGIKVSSASAKIRIRGSKTISSDVEHESIYKPQSGQLTAGEINDLEKWEDWKKLLKRDSFTKIKNDWKFIETQNKLEIIVKDEKERPIINAVVLCFDANKNLIQKSKTDVFGKAIIYGEKDDLKLIQVIYKKKIKGLNLPENLKDITFTFPENEQLNDIDVMFTIDATGSMGDEIDYLKSEIENIINRVDKKIEQKRIGLTFYRDKTDDYLVKDFDFTTDISKVKTNLLSQSADGGGDYEEAVEEALKVSLSKSWNENAKSKLLFLLLDAPPHLNQENIATIRKQIRKAQEKGIKIVPIVASGADKTVEFLMRYFSVSTNGTYVFLTDDSGIGNPHLKPTTSDFKVEKLNDLIVRLIEKYAGV